MRFRLKFKLLNRLKLLSEYARETKKNVIKTDGILSQNASNRIRRYRIHLFIEIYYYVFTLKTGPKSCYTLPDRYAILCARGIRTTGILELFLHVKKRFGG